MKKTKTEKTEKTEKAAKTAKTAKTSGSSKTPKTSKTSKSSKTAEKTASPVGVAGGSFFDRYRAAIVAFSLVAVLLALGYLAYLGVTAAKAGSAKGSGDLPYREEVARAAEKYGVEAARIYAVIRVESDFVADARSPHGALGLMQMIPSTYEEQCEARGVPCDPDDLLKPDVNIDFCTEYLSQAYRAAGGWDWAHVAYFAGIGNVREWQKAGYEPSQVPMEGARKYLEKIKSAYEAYQPMLAAKTE